MTFTTFCFIAKSNATYDFPLRYTHQIFSNSILELYIIVHSQISFYSYTVAVLKSIYSRYCSHPVRLNQSVNFPLFSLINKVFQLPELLHLNICFLHQYNM